MMASLVNVFVSSTWLDLQPEREAIEKALQRLRETKFVGMEYFGSRDEDTRRASLDEVDRCQVYIGILAGRYGSGITEAEYRRAREQGLPCRIYFKDKAHIPPEWWETDPEKADRLARLKEELRQHHTIDHPPFTTPDGLAANVTADLHNWLFDEYLPPLLEKAAQGEFPREEAQVLLAAIKDLNALNQDLLAQLRAAGYVVAWGERSVAIGRDAIGGIFITGNHNQVFVGDYERLRDAYIPPWSVFERVDLKCFTGREWLLQEVDCFLHKHDRGVFILEAGAGLGKTTFLAWLSRERGYIHHFVELAPGLEGVGRGLKNLAAQLVRAWELNPYVAEGVLPGAAAHPDFLQNLLAEAARKRDEVKPGEKIILVVDALDEAGTPYDQNVLGLPRVLPEGVYLIVSERPVAVTMQVEAPRRVFPLLAESAENLADMRRFLEKAATWSGIVQALEESGYRPEQFTTTLLEKCRGVWIYLHYVVHEIERSERSPLDLDALPDGMTQYYARYWQRWRDEDEVKWYEVYLPLLTSLAAAQEAVTVERLAEWAHVKTPVQKLRRLLNERWRPFLAIAEEGQDACYRFYHATLREFFDGRVEHEKLTAAEEALVDELAEATREAHGRLADHYLVAWGGLEAGLPELQDPEKRDLDGYYGLRHLAVHLEGAGWFEQLYALVESEAWCKTKRVALGSHHSFSRDVELAICAVDSKAEESLPRLIAYSLLVGTLGSLSTEVPPVVLAALSRLDRAEEALQIAELMVDERRRSEALSSIASVLWKQDQKASAKNVSEQAIEIAKQTSDEWERVSALCAVGRNLLRFSPDRGLSVLRQALDRAEKVDEAYRIHAIHEVISEVADATTIAPKQVLSLLGCCLEIIDNWTDTPYGNSALAKVAGAFRVFDPERSDELFRRALLDLERIKENHETRAEFIIAEELARAGAYDWAEEVVRDLVPVGEKTWAYQEIAYQAAMSGEMGKIQQLVKETEDTVTSPKINRCLARHYVLEGHVTEACDLAKQVTGWERGLTLIEIAEAMLERHDIPQANLIAEAIEELQRGPEEPGLFPLSRRRSLEQWGKVVDELVEIEPREAQKIIDRILIEAEVLESSRHDYKFWSELAKCLAEKGELDLALEVARKLPDQRLGWLPHTWSVIAIEMIKREMLDEAKELSEQIEVPEYKSEVTEALQKKGKSAGVKEQFAEDEPYLALR